MDWTAIISGAAAGALVSAIGTVIGARINAKSQERIAGLNHQHEVAIQVLDDRRRLRDAKVDRLRNDLATLADITIEVHTNVWYFITNPDIESKQVSDQAARLNEMLIGVRGRILVDADSRPVLDRLNQAYFRYQVLADSWRDYRGAQAKQDADAPQMGKDAREEAGKLLSDLKDLLDEPRGILEKYEQPVTP